MLIKKYRPFIALILFLFIQWQLNVIESQITIYTIVGILALYSLF